MPARDVQLIIRAKDDASRAVDRINDALETLLTTGKSASTGTAAGINDLLSRFMAIDKVVPVIEGAANKGEAAFKRMSASLEDTKAKLVSVQAQMVQSAQAIDVIQRKIVSTKLDGGDTGPLIARLGAARQAYLDLSRQQEKLRTSTAAQETSLGQSRSSLQQLGSMANAAQAALAALGTEAERSALKTKAAVEQQTAAWREEAAAAREAVAAQQAGARNNSILGVTTDPKGATARQSAAVFEEQFRAVEAVAASARMAGAAVAEAGRAAADAQSDMAAQAQLLRDRLDPLASIQRKLNQELSSARALYAQGAISATELAHAEQFLAINARNAEAALNRVGRGVNGKASLFGLKPYELTNLSFQVNDVVTGLVSGQSAAQVLAQQGGQIIQIFPKAGAAVVGALSNPAILTSAAALVTIVAAIKKTVDESQRLRTFEGALAATAAGTGLTAQALSDAAAKMDKFGASAEDAVASVRTFLREGVDPARMEEFGRAAQNMADIMGTDVKEAAKGIAEAFTGGYQAIAKLDDAQNFLTVAEREHIRVLFDSGKAAEARSEAFRIFEQRMDQGATKARGPWSRAVKGLDVVWNGLLDTLRDTSVIKTAITFLDSVVSLLGKIGDTAGRNGAPAAGQEGVAQARETAGLDRQIAFLQSRIATLKQTLAGVGLPEATRKSIQALINDLNKGLGELQARRDALNKDPGGNNPKISKEVVDARIDAQAASQAIRLEEELGAARRRGNEARAIAKAGELEYQKALKETGNVQIANARRGVAETQERSRLNEQRITSGAALVTTARRFDGFNENKSTDRNGLMDFFRSAGIDLDPSKLAWCAAFVNAVLNANGLPQQLNAGGKPTVAAADFKSFGSGVSVSEAEPGDIVVLNHHVGIFAGFDGPNRIKLIGGNQGGGKRVQTSSFARSAVLAVRRAPLGDAASAAGAQFEQQRAQQQTDFDNTITRENQARDRQVSQAERLLGLSGEQLLAEQRRQAIETSLADKQQEADRNHVELTAAARAEIEKTVGAAFDLQHAQERAIKPAQELNDLRQALVERFNTALETGDTTSVDLLEKQLGTVDKALSEAIDRAESWWAQWDTPEANAAVAGLESLRNQVKRTGIDLGQKRIDILSGDRQGALDRLSQARDLGDNGQVAALEQQIRSADADILKLIDHQVELWTVIGGPAAERAIAAYQGVRNEIKKTARDTALADIQNPLTNASNLRGELLQGKAAAQDRGDTKAVEEFRRTIAETDAEILKLIDDTIAYYQTSQDPNAQAQIAHFQNLREEILNTREAFAISAGDIQQAFAGDMVSSVTQFAEALGEGRNVISSLADAARTFASSFLRDLGEMLLKALALKVAMKIGFGGASKGLNSLLAIGPVVAAGFVLRDAGGKMQSAGTTLGIAAIGWAIVAKQLQAAAIALGIAKGVSAGVAHTGGVAGNLSVTRSVLPGLFAGAMHYHTGGIAGLRPNEVPAILQRGEEILTRSDPRHRFNGGGGGPAPETKVDLQVVNAFDAGDFVSKGLSSRVGQRTFMNLVRSNRSAISELIK